MRQKISNNITLKIIIITENERSWLFVKLHIYMSIYRRKVYSLSIHEK